ncbi:hypothetical protein AS034_16340 [[Bacillus] enclensis]|uniref:Uncharacterized protein n=1 Tax=[Bacillus] enclensis TaxID=1402860 RepID=A0A0V8HD04_9BACI|nr:DUF6241 domain-containing protein [[Bacillus] enclensis]KSU60409.1 hypothetical protein AS034_16340 [[Bacillus] enclensis]SCC24191.1 hypothetical protein GA0061094_3380 [[Bacillus] enclensis]
MSKKLVMYILGSVLLVTVMGVYLVVGSLDQPARDSETAGSAEAGSAAESAATADADADKPDSSVEANNSNPFENDVRTPLKETHMQQYIHAMSHQKVQAKEKWSFFEITGERIDFLLGQLETNKYEHEDLYRGILKNWKEGDFSNAVKDHNAIWRLQEGTVGIATGLLNPEAEEAFLQKQKKESR